MALFVQHGALSDSVSLPTVSLVSRRLSGLQQMTESCKVREKTEGKGNGPDSQLHDLYYSVLFPLL